MSSSQETFRSAYPPDPYPAISYGLPYPEACAKHINQTFKCHRVYILCSGTISRTGAYLQDLIDALGSGNVVGIRRGMTPHSLWSEILEVANEARNSEADCIVTLGAGSLTDAAKIVVLVISVC
jgi:alcohol dehydrogenase class IV